MMLRAFVIQIELRRNPSNGTWTAGSKKWTLVQRSELERLEIDEDSS
jgi:hypothetical protein